MAYTTINKSTDHFNTKLYTGNGGTNAITGVGFQPDLVWIKDRDATGYHFWTDAVRGVTKTIFSNTNGAEGTEAAGLTAFGTDGFTVGSHTNINTSGRNIASWNWKAGGGQGSSNTDGSINTTYTSVNTTAGFSICKWTGTGSAATIGHGLGSVPKMIIVKTLDSATAWTVYHGANTSEPQTDRLYLNTTDATSDSDSSWNDTAPTSTLFSVGASNETNKSGSPMIAYCFAEKTGYSKFGQYYGNENTDGTFIYTGMKPSFVILKKTGNTGNWMIYDNKREGYNVDNDHLKANEPDAEGTSDDIDILSNGFKLRTSGGGENQDGQTFIYIAFGQSLVGSNNVPCTAR